MKKTNLHNLVVLALALLTTSCGGGGGGEGGMPPSTTPSSTSLTGYFVDSFVEGADFYLNGQRAGKTGEEGAFQYSKNDTVTFKIGNAEIGTIEKVPDDGFVFLHDIVGVPREWSEVPELLHIATFVQSLDEDGNPDNGIKIPQSASEYFTDPIKIKDLAYVEMKLNIEKAGGRIQSLNRTQAHLESVTQLLGMTVYRAGENYPPLMHNAIVGLPPLPSN